MFPNDEICNIEAAKKAAQRIFTRYGTQNQSSTLDKSQVNRLMKNAYSAINMPYNPNQQDVSSFISVFGSSKEENIQLKDFQKLAVKYLCGEEQGAKEEKCQVVKKEVVKRKQQLILKKAPILKVEQIKSRPPIHFNQISSPKQNKTFSFMKEPNSLQTTSVLDDSAYNFPKKMNNQAIIEKGRNIFTYYANSELKAITIKEAHDVMIKTYEIFDKKFNPHQADVELWMKLVDRNKNGKVNWEDYEYFLMRTIEREIGRHKY